MSSASINDLANKLSFYTPPGGELKRPAPPAAQPASRGMFASMFASSTPPVVEQTDEESAGLMSWASAKMSAARSSVDDLSATRERFTTFAILAACGSVCMVLAFTFLPIVIISPHKFALLFTLGSALILASFSFLRGHAVFLKHLASMDRLPFSASYGTSLIGTLYSSLVMNSYLLTMVFSIIQVVALSYFLVSYIPGGTSALSFIGTMAGNGVRSIFVRTA